MDASQVVSPEQAEYTDIPDIIELLEEFNLDLEDIHYTQFMVYKDKGNLIGVGRVREHEDLTLELCSLGVLEEHRKKGIGMAIVSALIEAAEGKDIWAVSEIPAYFNRSGFKQTESYPFVLKEKMDRCIQQYCCSKPVVLIYQDLKS